METLKNILYFDTETTGLPAKGAKWDIDFKDFPRIAQIAWIVNDKKRSYIIKPEGWTIPEETTKVHGISQERAEKEGVLFKDIIDEFLNDCRKARKIVAHNIYFDTSIIKAMILFIMGRDYYDEMGEIALDKTKRIDTMMKSIKFVGAKYKDGRPGKYPRLEELYEKLFPGETFSAHDALEDVKALVRCFPPLVEMGIICLDGNAPAPKPMQEPKKTKTAKRIIEFHDPNPVTKPIGTEPVPETKKEEPGKANKMLDENDF